MKHFFGPALLLPLLFLGQFLPLTSPARAAEAPTTVRAVFDAAHEVQTLLDIEAALARSQASLDIIPDWAAEEITRKADASYVPLDALAAERDRVRHRMVALLNVWGRSLDDGAEEYVHFGATTVDIYDTLLVLQLLDAGQLLRDDLLELEAVMMDLAQRHRETVMIGRTLGQHALPITFGKKVSTWLGENRRNIERLDTVLARLERSGILKGAVGSYLGLGPQGMAVEARFVEELGLAPPYPDDWHGARDVIADYAVTWALVARSLARVGNELFLLQMTDIGETEEVRRASAVGSSTMPHKKNPSKSEALMHYGRTIPRLAEVLLDDMVNVFERDNTSRPNRIPAELSIEAAGMLRAATGLLRDLRVNEAAMRRNLDRTRGLVMAQRVTFALADELGKSTANDAIHEVASYALENNLGLREAIRAFPEVSGHLDDAELDALLDVETYVGLAAEQVDAVIAWCEAAREAEEE